MITHEDQLNLFGLISRNLKKDVGCWAFGGTAMMFYGYKDETKDIDLLFENEDDRKTFIEAIERMGFRKTSPFQIYIQRKAEDKGKPLMYEKDGVRFDIFVKKIFRTQLSPKMKDNLYAVHDFTNGKELRINVLQTEHLAYLKAITERKNDFDDILLILKNDQKFSWQNLIDETIWQHKHGDDWALLDVEKMLQDLKEYVFVEEKYLKQLYEV